ncbi:reverse transcriptase domain-containing protein [Tanacetum coccineum]
MSRPLQGMEICYTPTEKMVHALIHTTRSLRAISRRHKVKVVTDGLMEEILKLSRREGRLAKWAAKVRTYDISYIRRKKAEGSVVKRFFRQGEQIEETPNANKGGMINLSKKLQANQSDEKMHSYAIRLKFNASDYAIDCETLLAGLAASVSKCMKDLHVFMDSPKLIAQTEGNHMSAIEQERKVGNHKVGISQSGSISKYQNKTISGGYKQQQKR